MYFSSSQASNICSSEWILGGPLPSNTANNNQNYHSWGTNEIWPKTNEIRPTTNESQTAFTLTPEGQLVGRSKWQWARRRHDSDRREFAKVRSGALADAIDIIDDRSIPSPFRYRIRDEMDHTRFSPARTISGGLEIVW